MHPRAGRATVRWRFDDGAAATGEAVTHAFATSGRHTATVTVSDPDGHRASATATVEVIAAPTPATQPTAPRITRLRVTPSRVRIGTPRPRPVRRSARRPPAMIRFRTSKKATVTLRFAKLRTNGAPRKLTTEVRIKARKGRNRIRFAARPTRRVTLRPGAYRLTMVATDTAGNRSKAARTRFTAVTPTRR